MKPLNGNRDVEYAVLDKTDPGDVALAVAIAADHIVEELRQLGALLQKGAHASPTPSASTFAPKSFRTCTVCSYEGFLPAGTFKCPDCGMDLNAFRGVEVDAFKRVATAAKPEDRNHGAYKKFDVRRLGDPEGKHAACEYFVLDLDHDVYSAKALEAYATACSSELPALAADIRKMRVVAVPKRRLMGGWGWKCAVCDKTVLHKDGKTFTDHVCTMRESAANLISKFQGSDCKHAHIVRNSDGKCRCFLCLEELHG